MSSSLLHFILFVQFILLLPVASAIGKLNLVMSQVNIAKMGHPRESEKANKIMETLVHMYAECHVYIKSQYRTFGIIVVLMIITSVTHSFGLNLIYTSTAVFWLPLTVANSMGIYLIFWINPGLHAARSTMTAHMNELIVEVDRDAVMKSGFLHLNLDKPFDMELWTDILTKEFDPLNQDKKS